MELPVVYSRRFANIIEEALEKMDLLRFTNNTPSDNEYLTSESLIPSDNYSSLINNQKNLTLTFENLLNQRPYIKSLDHNKKIIQHSTQIKDTTYQLQDVTRSLCRVLKDQQHSDIHRQKFNNEWEKLYLLMKNSVNDLYNDCSFGTLRDQINQYFDQRRQLYRLQQKEKDTKQLITNLTNELHSQQEFHFREQALRDQIIKQLRSTLKNKKETAKNETKYEERAIWGQFGSFNRKYQQQIDNLEEEIKKVKDRIELEQSVSQKTQEFYIRKISNEEETVDFWKEKLNQELHEKMVEIKNLTHLREEGYRHLTLLRHRWHKEQTEEAVIMKKINLSQQEKLAEATAQERRHQQAALIIQRWWRSKIHLLKKKRKKGGKGKKGVKKPKKFVGKSYLKSSIRPSTSKGSKRSTSVKKVNFNRPSTSVSSKKPSNIKKKLDVRITKYDAAFVTLKERSNYCTEQC